MSTDAPTINRAPSTSKTDKKQEKQHETITPGDAPDDERVQELDSPKDLPERKGKTQKEKSSFGTTTLWDRAKDKVSKASEAAGKRARRIQHRSAEHDAQKAREVTEKVTNEIGSTLKGLVQSGVSIIVGASYGTITGLGKSTLPVHAKTIQAADQLYHAGTWSELHRGVRVPKDNGKNELADRFVVDFNEEAAHCLHLGETEGHFYVDSSATRLKMTDPDGNRVEAISSPIYEPKTDRLIGILAFINEGPYAGQILMHVEDE